MAKGGSRRQIELAGISICSQFAKFEILRINFFPFEVLVG